MTLVALALAGGPLSADRLAETIWGEELPTTWPVALRGVVQGLRAACTPLGGGGQHLIVTAPAGYQLAEGVEVDVERAAVDVRRAEVLLAEGRYGRVVEVAEPITRSTGDRLLPGDEAGWLDAPRRALDATALHATQLVVEAAGRLGDHRRAVETAHRAVTSHPLDESTHRSLIAALDRSGDRAGAVQAFERCRSPARRGTRYRPEPRDGRGLPGRAARSGGCHLCSRPVTVVVVRRTRIRAGRPWPTRSPRPGLVTVTGRGGVGKSRLVMRLAAGLARFSGERLWVPLSAVAEDELVAASVALEIGVATGSEDPARALGDHVASQGRILLVLDGCERVVDGVASLAATLLASAPLLTLVVTSRRRLSIDGERVMVVEPLPPPDPDAAGLLENSQVRLLVDRVRESGGDLSIDDVVAPHLIELCRRCAGLPLALELVAAQLAAMPAGDLLDHVSEISAGGDDGLRSIALSSYLLLEDDEAVVFRRFAVLDGPVGLPLVRQVVSGGSITAVRVVRILRELTARSLLTVDRTGPRWRYEQDDDLHRFARELLVESGEEREAYGRLADAVRAHLPDGRAGDASAVPGGHHRHARLGAFLAGRGVQRTGRSRNAARSWRSGCIATSPRPTSTRAGSGWRACSPRTRSARGRRTPLTRWAT